MYIRSLFEANKHIRDPRQQRVSLSPGTGREKEGAMVNDAQALFQEAEGLLETWKHPDPYHAPTAPGGQSCAGWAVLIESVD